MSRIMEFLAKETDGKSYDTYKYSFDALGVPSIEYDDAHTAHIQWEEKGETIKYSSYISLENEAASLQRNGADPIFQYFLDGSRHVYKVDDISYNHQVYPVVAGQVGVGCCCRVNKIVKPFILYRKLVIAMPDKCDRNGWGESVYFKSLTDKLNRTQLLRRLNLQFDDIVPYTTAKTATGSKLDDIAVGKVQDYMIEHEKLMVAELVKKGCLGPDSYMIKDGSLEYSSVTSTRREDLRSIQTIRNNYKWVVGISKSFNPESCKDYKNKPNADYIANLPLYCRTPVARYKNPDFLGDTQYAVWYVRIRDRKHSLTPFDGVIKVEKIMMDDEIDEGIDSDEVDLITANLINERNPTCYGADRRWANHLYPVYLTETYIKSKYIGQDLFLSLF